jgi:hypothetical protein
MNIYQENGYKNRKDYLECMSEDYGVPMETVLMFADLYGPSEDWDGLINAVEDYADGELS